MATTTVVAAAAVAVSTSSAVLSSSSSRDTIGELLKFLEATAGRDRFARFLQYFTKYLKWREESRKRPVQPRIDVLQSIYSSMSMTRKILRFFRAIAVYRSAVETWGNRAKFNSQSELFFNLMAKAFLASYFLFDHFMFLKNVGAIPNIPWLNTATEGSWLGEIVCNIMEALIKLANANGLSADGRNALLRAIVRNCLDFPLALHFLGLAPASVPHGYYGLSGAISSAMGIYEGWPTVLVQHAKKA
jgi:peroxin-11B